MNVLLSVSLAAAVVVGAYAPQHVGSEPLAPPLEARVQKLGKELRCPVCQGLSIADSPSSTARAQLDKVRELVSAGRTDEEVRQYFVARYGEWVLLQPTAEGANLVVWLGPVLLLVGGVAFIALFVRKSARSPAPAEAGGPPQSTPPEKPAPVADPYLDAVRAELER